MSFLTKLADVAVSAASSLSFLTAGQKSDENSKGHPSNSAATPPVKVEEVGTAQAAPEPVAEPETVSLPTSKRKGKKGPGQDGRTRAERREDDKLRTQARNKDRLTKAMRRRSVDAGMGCQF